ncbi:doublesex- and mab-3-related transcription factor dmd-3-like [Chironomus tepperi]|uniref:doublesex- and mab-3-related transcription factor dmd-3-like n=1 Tax=Chironomus tepperi TaxID=113505 RepID=UPI00391F8059
MMASARIRREQVCARCRNHGMASALKGHKKFCAFLDCDCVKCRETKIRQKFIAREIAFHRKNSKSRFFDERSNSTEAAAPKLTNDIDISSNKYLCEVRRNQMCARCRNHGENQLIRGHKNSCKYNNCSCEKCQITKERRKIMAKQIKDYRMNPKNLERMESLALSDYAAKYSEENDSGYSTSPNTSPEADVEMISFPTIIEECSNSSDKDDGELTIDLTEKPDIPDIEPIFSRIPPEMLNTFYMVQSLYEKYCLNDCQNKIQFVYAFVLLAHQNWSFVEGALTKGLLYSEEFFKYHQHMASENLSEASTSLPRLLSSPQQVRVKPMNGKF